MKKSGALIGLILLMAGIRGFALDIYVNDNLWQSFSSGDLNDLRVTLSSGTESRPGVPLPELMPLMSGLEAVRVAIPGGEALLEVDVESIRGSALLQTAGGEWDLSLRGSLYHGPLRIEIYGTVHPSRTITVWAEQGLAEYCDQLKVWASLHRVEVVYKEIPRIGDELIHSRMTGDLMPDFILRYLASDEDFDMDHTLSYTLESILAPRENRVIDTLVLPSGYKSHPDLYLSILASFSDRESPYSPAIPADRESHRRATAVYAGLILNHRILELQDYQTSTAFREGNYAFFPAGDFSLQTGIYLSPGEMTGINHPLSSRVYPLILVTQGEDLAEGTLLDFLKLPGIQYKLFSSARRQVPADVTVLDSMKMDENGRRTVDDWKQGYILSLENDSLTREIFRRLPDILRVEGGLP